MADFINNEKGIACYRSKEELAVLNAKTAAAQPKPKTTAKTTTPAANKTTTPSANKTATTDNKTTTADNNAPVGEKKTTTTSPTSKFVYHTVQRGDSLWSIASKYPGVSIDDIKKLNNLGSRYVIQPGQKLKIMPKG
jgi:LysM repeat protein